MAGQVVTSGAVRIGDPVEVTDESSAGGMFTRLRSRRTPSG